MFILKNAWKAVVRNRGRNILIAIIVAIIAATATVGLAIRNTASSIAEEGLQSTTVSATIGIDRSKLMEQAQTAASTDTDSDSDTSTDTPPDFDAMRSQLSQDALSLTDYEKYEKAVSVPVSSYYSESTSLEATDAFQPVSTTESDTSTDTEETEGGPGGQGGGMGDMESSGDFTLTGFSSDTAVENASNGSFTLNDGEVFGYDSDSDGDVIISQALADFNSLEVGDTITVTKTIDDTSTSYDLTVSGIYENTSTQNTGSMGPMGGTSQDPDNAIYTSVSTLESLGIDSESDDATDAGTQLNYTYVLSSADDYETFQSDVTAAGLDDAYTVSSSDVDAYEASLAPMENLSSFTLTFLLIVLAVGAIVLVVLNLFSVRERKYEVGVMTAIGVKKPKVALQFVAELLMVTMVGLGIGVIGGAAVSGPVSNQLLSSQVSTQETEAASQQQQFGRPSDMGGGPTSASDQSDTQSAPNDPTASATASSDSYVSSLDARVNLTVVGQLVLIGLGLTLVSSLVGIIFVMRYEPLQILAERS